MGDRNKRPRLELANGSIFLNNNTNTDDVDVVSNLPANVFLTICDDDEEISEDDDYITLNHNGILTNTTTTTSVKLEQDAATQTPNSLPIQYRLINHLQKQVSMTPNVTVTNINNNNNNQITTLQQQQQPMTTAVGNTTLPAAVQLPSGCEIYLIKEYINNTAITKTTSTITPNRNLVVTTGPSNIITGITKQHQQQRTVPSLPSPTPIKLEPSPLTVNHIVSNTGVNHQAAGSGGIGVGNTIQFIRGNNEQYLLTTPKVALTTVKVAAAAAAAAAPATTTTTTTAGTVVHKIVNDEAAGGEEEIEEEDNKKKNIILEAYKKRDDKRRATHNEVERRRRDKINSWIFKLKEMLPADLSGPNSMPRNGAAATQQLLTAQRHQQQQLSTKNSNNNATQGTSNRTPPSDSKSQILIKACEYIKIMQDEIKSLRECLTENENLRLCNQQLEIELEKLKNLRNSEQQQQQHLLNSISNPNSNGNFNVTLNTLNSLNCNDSNAGVELFVSTTTSPITSTLDPVMGGGGSVGCSNGLGVVGIVGGDGSKRELIIRDFVD